MIWGFQFQLALRTNVTRLEKRQISTISKKQITLHKSSFYQPVNKKTF